jgi:hypothetical protein
MMLIRIARSPLSALAILVGISSPATAQTPRTDSAGDVSAGYSIMHDSASLTFNGVRVSGAKNLSESWAAVVEVGADRNGSGVYRSSSGTHLYTYTDKTVLGGFRLRRVDASSSALFFQALGGYFGRSDDLNNGPPTGNFAVRVEGGLDIGIASHLALRLGGGWTFLNGGTRYMNQIGANAGVAYLFGKR